VVVAKEYFDAHTNRAVNLEEAAQVAHLSPHHFKRTFKAAFGQSPHQYHLKQRLRVAAELLKSGETVASAGVSTGFEDAGTLIRGFRKEFGHTPGMHQRLAHTRN
jgi:AraC-like DNA-binding protein